MLFIRRTSLQCASGSRVRQIRKILRHLPAGYRIGRSNTTLWPWQVPARNPGSTRFGILFGEFVVTSTSFSRRRWMLNPAVPIPAPPTRNRCRYLARASTRASPPKIPKQPVETGVHRVPRSERALQSRPAHRGRALLSEHRPDSAAGRARRGRLDVLRHDFDLATAIQPWPTKVAPIPSPAILK